MHLDLYAYWHPTKDGDLDFLIISDDDLPEIQRSRKVRNIKEAFELTLEVKKIRGG